MRKKLPKHIVDFMDAADWFFGTRYYDRSIKFEESDSSGVLAEITVVEEYKQIVINFYPKFFTYDRREQINTLIHEYVHKLIEPLQTEAKKPHENKFSNTYILQSKVEQVTSDITERLVRLFDGKIKYMVKAYKKAVK